MSGSVGTALVTALALCAAATAHADRHHRKKKPTATGSSDDKPWSQGVSKADQQQATELFAAGNALFEQSKYTEAAAQYERALEKWDNPKIEYNLVLCLLNMRQPLDAWDHLESALEYGEDGLGKRLFDDAQSHKTTLESTLALVEVDSEQDGVVIMFDGHQLFSGKGSKELHVLAGKHQLVATREGYETESRALDLPAGETTKQTIKLQPQKIKITRENYERRWAWWVPWSTAGAGVALALVGTGVYLAARSDMRAYDAELLSACPQGCSDAMAAKYAGDERHARLVSQVGIGFWVGGAAVAGVAGVMAYLNRPTKVVHEETRPDISVTVTPSFVGASLSMTFR